MIIAIIILAVLLILLLFRPQRSFDPRSPPVELRRRDDSDGIIFGETPGGLWEGGPLPEETGFTPGGGDSGGGGASGDWGRSDGGDSSNS
jgi:uncharacterized membrane protein YgcG